MLGTRLSLYRLPAVLRIRRSSGVAVGSEKASRSLVAAAHGSTSSSIPIYLQNTYWWAYLHPKGVNFFERPWIVNSILWGNYDLLATEMIREIDPSRTTLQVACAYGSVTPRLARHMQVPLDVVDVAPIQLENLKKKLDAGGTNAKVHLSVSDASKLTGFADASREQVIFFFLLHEVPQQVRREALAEAWRVLSNGGKLVIIDYHQPSSRWNFHRYFMPIIFHTLEPFAMDLWRSEIVEWLPEAKHSELRKELFFHGLYQKLVITKKD